MVTLIEKDFSLIEFEPASEDDFIHVGFNRAILNNGPIHQFYDCCGCANATASKPGQCEKCNTINFVHRNIKGAIGGVRYLTRT